MITCFRLKTLSLFFSIRIDPPVNILLLLVDATVDTALSIDALFVNQLVLSIDPTLILDPATHTDEGSCFAMLFFCLLPAKYTTIFSSTDTTFLLTTSLPRRCDPY